MSKLAILGSEPAFPECLHVGRPNIGDREAFLRRVNEMLDRRWLTNDGPLVREFEQRIAELIGVKHCLAMCNATAALEIAIRALDLRGEVILPSYTFVATAHALKWQEINPVFADVDPETHNIDPFQIQRLITPQTSGIIGVHLWGRPCDTEGIERIGQRYGIKTLYDAAHAFGCSKQGRAVGTFGSCEIFSFHATKFLTTFEGGAIVTNDDMLAKKIRLMRNFGFSGYDNVIYLGINGKMSEVCAAMGLSSLEIMDTIIAKNRLNYESYRIGLQRLPGLSLINYSPSERNNYQYIVVEVDQEVSPLNRDELVQVLHAENILARKYFWPGCHQMEPYRSQQPEAHHALRETERIASRVIILPTGTAVEPHEVTSICEIIRAAFQSASEVKHKLRHGCPMLIASSEHIGVDEVHNVRVL